MTPVGASTTTQAGNNQQQMVLYSASQIHYHLILRELMYRVHSRKSSQGNVALDILVLIVYACSSTIANV